MICCPLTKDKVVRPEQLSEWAGAHRVHGSWLEVDQNGTRDIFAAFGRKRVEDRGTERGDGWKGGVRYQQSLYMASEPDKYSSYCSHLNGFNTAEQFAHVIFTANTLQIKEYCRLDI